MPAHILAAKKSVGGTLEVNLRDHVTCMPPPSVNKAAHSGFETKGRRHQKSKSGVSVAPRKDSCPPKKILSTNLLTPMERSTEYPPFK